MKLTKKPSLREKKRYIYFKVHSSGNLKYFDLKNSILNSVLDLVGELGFAEANPHLVKNLWDEKNKAGVIRCSHRSADKIKLALSLIHQIGEEKVILQTIRVSGTIKGTGKNQRRGSYSL